MNENNDQFMNRFMDLKGAKKVFIDVDTQKDFMNKDGKLYVPEAENIKENLSILTKYALTNGIPILSTVDKHVKDDPEFKIFPPHCVVDTDGINKIPETSPITYGNQNEIRIFHKSTYDIFDEKLGNHIFKSILVDNKVEEAVVYGVATDYCIKAAVLGLLKLNIEVTVIIDAIAGVNEKTTEEAMNEIIAAGGSFIGVCSL